MARYEKVGEVYRKKEKQQLDCVGNCHHYRHRDDWRVFMRLFLQTIARGGTKAAHISVPKCGINGHNE